MAQAFDFKKADKSLYLPGLKPVLIQVPRMRFFAVDGKGNPNTAASYLEAVALLYGLSYTVKMAKMSGATPPGYFDYVVPPLEGLWQLTDRNTAPGNLWVNKDALVWTSLIRAPDFVTAEVFEQARAQLAAKKPELDSVRARLWDFEEGLCVQLMHLGSYDDEPASVRKINAFLEAEGYQPDMGGERRHHEIYLSDPRRTVPEKLRTVIRHPVVKK